MKKVRMIFARDHEGKRYSCDTIHDIDDTLAKEWIGRGIAEPAGPQESDAPKTIDDMKAGELVKYAEENGYDIGGLQAQAGKEKILTALKTAIDAKAQA